MKMVTSESQTLVPCSVSDFLSVPNTEALCPDHTYRPSCQRRGQFIFVSKEGMDPHSVPIISNRIVQTGPAVRCAS